jgi:hypothetical protein
MDGLLLGSRIANAGDHVAGAQALGAGFDQSLESLELLAEHAVDRFRQLVETILGVASHGATLTGVIGKYELTVSQC